MKILTVSLLSLIFGLFLGYSAVKTAEQIAKSTMSKIEIMP